MYRVMCGYAFPQNFNAIGRGTSNLLLSMMMMRMLPIVLTLFFSRWRVAPLCQPTFDVRTMHCTAGAMRPYRLGWTCTTWFLAWFLRICWSAPLLWSSTGGGWRAMFADVGYVNVFRQAGLLTANATQFTSVVCVHMIIIIIIIWLICLIAPYSIIIIILTTTTIIINHCYSFDRPPCQGARGSPPNSFIPPPFTTKPSWPTARNNCTILWCAGWMLTTT